MKKLLLTFLFTLVLSGGASANKISIQCVGENTPNATFTITNEHIIVSDGFVFDLEGVTSSSATGYKNYYKRNFIGIKKLETSWNILINLDSRTASIVTYREWEAGIAKDISRRYYSDCR